MLNPIFMLLVFFGSFSALGETGRSEDITDQSETLKGEFGSAIFSLKQRVNRAPFQAFLQEAQLKGTIFLRTECEGATLLMAETERSYNHLDQPTGQQLIVSIYNPCEKDLSLDLRFIESKNIGYYEWANFQIILGSEDGAEKPSQSQKRFSLSFTQIPANGVLSPGQLEEELIKLVRQTLEGLFSHQLQDCIAPDGIRLKIAPSWVSVIPNISGYATYSCPDILGINIYDVKGNLEGDLDEIEIHYQFVKEEGGHFIKREGKYSANPGKNRLYLVS